MGTKIRRARPVRLCWAVLATVWAVLLTSCSVETRYRVLTVFFEGVPPPGATPGGVEGPAGQDTRLENPTSAHTAFREGRCRSCHIAERKPLKTTVPELCWECHEPPTEDKPWGHGPARAGDCLACHVGHETMLPALLAAEGKSLCYTCHRDSYIESISSHDGINLENCERCHLAHEGGTVDMPAEDGSDGRLNPPPEDGARDQKTNGIPEPVSRQGHGRNESVIGNVSAPSDRDGECRAGHSCRSLFTLALFR